MRALPLALLGAAAYGVFLAALAPASVVVARLPRIDGVELREARGTLWKGTARARVALAAGALEIDELAWRFAPARLLAGRIAFDVTARNPGLEAAAQVARGFGGFEARDVSARGDAAQLVAALPLLAPFRPQGAVSLAAPLLSWDARELRGRARAEWRGASASLPEPRALGSYVAELQGDGGPAKVTLATTEGALRLAGDGTLVPPGRLTLRGEARAEPAAEAALAPLLDLLGPRRADGARAFEFRSP